MGFFWFSVPTSSGAEKQDLILRDWSFYYTTMRGKTHPPLTLKLSFSATSRLDTSPALESAFGSPEQMRFLHRNREVAEAKFSCCLRFIS